MAYEQLAKDILTHVGGPENVNSLVHCATRLRFVLKDTDKANKEELEKLDIISVMQGGGQYQVVIGTHVSNVYEQVMSLLPNISTSDEADTSKGKTNILDLISGSITPLIPAMIGSGMIKAIVTLLVNAGLLTAESPLFATLNAASNAVFYFLPLLVAFTFANKLKTNPYLATVVVASLLEPNFTGLIGQEGLGSVFGLPFAALDYSSQILPAFLAVAIMALLEKGLKKVLPVSLQMVFVPTLILLILVPLTVLVLGPVMIAISGLLSTAITAMIDFSAILTGLILGATWVFLVMFGMHWAVLPLMLNNLTLNGSDPLLGMLMATVWTSGGIALGVALKTKDKKLKSVAYNSLIPCFLSGVSEPILYGIFVPYRKAAVIYMIISGALSALGGVLGVKATQLAGGIFTIPTFTPISSYLLIIALSIILPTIAIMVFGYDSKKKEVA
ncbi:PTS transporter subunit EIIC [Streptococcus merionis]|uniref:PTS transporter subunit EIIC n=1 Tax=Streptococcus merionis TaxID=400065 RepID=UPI0026EA996F|nr:PTS transporter subunit EIIC [Streptococcus merionis]